MSEAIAFDTHRFVKHLTENGFTEQQAEVLADEQVHLLNTNLATQADIAAIHQDIDALRQETKADIDALRQETKADIAALRQETKASIAAIQREIEILRQETKADIEILRQETKTSIAGVQRDIAEVKSDLIKWLVGALIAQGGLGGGAAQIAPGLRPPAARFRVCPRELNFITASDLSPHPLFFPPWERGHLARCFLWPSHPQKTIPSLEGWPKAGVGSWHVTPSKPTPPLERFTIHYSRAGPLASCRT